MGDRTLAPGMPGSTEGGITHPFYDIEVESAADASKSVLVKILALDGRRFTYWLQAPWTPEAVAFIKHLIDSGVITDQVIEWRDGGLHTRDAPTTLKKHG